MALLSTSSPAKDLYRRLDRLLGEVHRRAHGQDFLEQALGALFSGFGAELDATGAQLFALEGALLQSIARAGVLDGVGSAPLALADLRVPLDPAQLHGRRVHLLGDEREAARPLAFFEVHHPARSYVFLFSFQPSWERDSAELILSTACSILSVKLLEEGLGATLREAAEIQRSLLPEWAPEFPGFDIAARSDPAQEVGGDWYDFLPLGEGALGISLGDASGHGLSSALMARDVVVGLRMGIERELKAGHVLEKLNRVIHKSALSSCFASMIYGELEENGSFFYYNAGQDAPLLVTDAGCEILRTGGPVLGPLPEARFRRHFAHLDRGATLVLHTDGLIERRTRSGELFGLERLQALLREGHGLPSAELVRRVFDAVERFGEDGRAPDDETLVVVRRLRTAAVLPGL